MNYVPSTLGGLLNTNEINYIPANMPGSQMMSNLSYIPAQTSLFRGAIGNNGQLGTYMPSITAPRGLNSDLNYIPCSTSAGAGAFGSTPETVLKYNLSWWEKEKSFFYYPQTLVSAFYGMKWLNFREFFNIPKDFILFGDSGGFQNLSSDRKLDWKAVLDWQESNCDVIFSLDYPPSPDDDTVARQKKYDMSIENIKLMLNNKKDKKYYGCVHGFNQTEVENYYKQITSLGLDGIAHGQFAIRGLNLTSKLDRIILSNSLNQSKLPIHYFGLGTSIAIAFAYKLSKNFTYDNSSYGCGAIRREYILNTNTSIVLNQESKLNKLACNCPICSQLNHIDDMKGEGSIPGGLISLHNLWKEIEKDNWIKCLIDSPEDLFNYLNISSKSQEIQERFKYLFYKDDIEGYIKRFPFKVKFDELNKQMKF